MLAAERDEVLVGGVADDERHRHLTEPVVGHADHRRLRDPGREAEHFLDLFGEDLVAAAVDEVAGSPFDPHEAVGVDAGEVAGVHVAVGVDPVAQLLTGGVSRGHVGRPHEQGADLVGAELDPASSTTFRSTPRCGRPIAPTFSGCSLASAAVQPITSPISAWP